MIFLFAGGLDYTSISNEWLTFSSNVLRNDITINITDDLLFEYNEVFTINMTLISEPFPGLRLLNNATVTIIDNDGKIS